MKRAFAAVLAVALLGVIAAVVYVRGGLYDVSAVTQHTQPVYSLLRTVMHYSVKRQARDIATPSLVEADLRRQGAVLYAAKCLPCHGAPGVAPHEFSSSMQPVPGPLVDARAHWLARELYWITRHGIKMTGMPAWEYRLAEEELWALVAFLTWLPDLSPQDFASLPLEPGRQRSDAVAPGNGADEKSLDEKSSDAADPARGLTALHQHGCNSCHVIPGITGPDVQVGPPLAGIASRKLIAGAVPNTPQQMARWLRDPKSIDPWTAMPAMGVGQKDARDMAAYLATLD